MTCKPSETVWAVESEVLTLSIEKVVHTWWECVVAGHAMIDTQMVDSTQQVHDYDEETQGAIRKIMFDQAQKAKGLPTSDELTQQQLLESAKDLPGSPLR